MREPTSGDRCVRLEWRPGRARSWISREAARMLDQVDPTPKRRRRKAGGRSRMRIAGVLSFGSGLAIVAFAAVPGASVRAVDTSGVFQIDGNTANTNANVAPYD